MTRRKEIPDPTLDQVVGELPSRQLVQCHVWLDRYDLAVIAKFHTGIPYSKVVRALMHEHSNKLIARAKAIVNGKGEQT